MIRSMTGFGAADGSVGGTRVGVEIRTVNHRFFNPSLKLPGAFQRWEGEVREALRQRVVRGHVTLFARILRDELVGAGPVVNDERVRFWSERLRALKDVHGLAGEVDLATVLRMPDVVGLPAEDEAAEGTAAELIAIVDQAVAALGVMRAEEGKRLVAVILDRLDVIAAALDRIAERAPQRLVEQRDRLRARVQELAAGVAVDEGRLAQEIAILADRLDVHEELDRFRAHIVAFRETLASPAPDGVGKRLGFLLQEMLREANTTGSKGNDTVMAREVIAVKEELERIREQVENLE